MYLLVTMNYFNVLLQSHKYFLRYSFSSIKIY